MLKRGLLMVITRARLLGADIETRLLRAANTDAVAVQAAQAVRMAFSEQVDHCWNASIRLSFRVCLVCHRYWLMYARVNR